MKKLPWFEIILIAILVMMIIVTINALYGEIISDSITTYCATQELWCAPATPTPTITITPTVTPTLTPVPTFTLIPGTTPLP